MQFAPHFSESPESWQGSPPPAIAHTRAEPPPCGLALPMPKIGNGSAEPRGPENILNLMLDPWSGKPLQFDGAEQAAVEERSMKSMDTSILTGSSATAVQGMELRRFAFVPSKVADTTDCAASPAIALGDEALERDPMERTTSPVPYSSKKQMPEWRDEDFEPDALDESPRRGPRVTFASS